MDWDELEEHAQLGKLQRTGALLRAHAWLERALKRRFPDDRDLPLSDLLDNAGVDSRDFNVLGTRGLRRRIAHEAFIPSLRHALGDIATLSGAVACIDDHDDSFRPVTDSLGGGEDGPEQLELDSRSAVLLRAGARSGDPFAEAAALALAVGLLHSATDQALLESYNDADTDERLPIKLQAAANAGLPIDPEDEDLTRAIAERNKVVHFGVDPSEDVDVLVAAALRAAFALRDAIELQRQEEEARRRKQEDARRAMEADRRRREDALLLERARAETAQRLRVETERRQVEEGRALVWRVLLGVGFLAVAIPVISSLPDDCSHRDRAVAPSSSATIARNEAVASPNQPTAAVAPDYVLFQSTATPVCSKWWFVIGTASKAADDQLRIRDSLLDAVGSAVSSPVVVIVQDRNPQLYAIAVVFESRDDASAFRSNYVGQAIGPLGPTCLSRER